MGVVRKLLGGIVAAVVVLAVAVVAAYAAGVLGVPTATVGDVGDWGTVTENRTEIVTTLRVHNPNPIGVTVGGGVRAAYDIRMNGVTVATGRKDRISIEPGNSTVELSTYVRNGRLVPWWVRFVRADETIRLAVDGTVTVETPLATFEQPFPPIERTVLEGRTPIISSLSSAASEAEGNYTRTVSGGDVVGGEVTAGLQVRRAWATWGRANRTATIVLFHFELHNPSEVVPAPATPDGLAARIEMNDVALMDVRGDAFSARNVGRDDVIAPGETREVVLAVRMDTEKIDEWFTSHVRRGERTRIDVQLQLVFEVEETGTTIRVPRDGGVTYTCELQTGILVDGQATATNCGEGGSASAG